MKPTMRTYLKVLMNLGIAGLALLMLIFLVPKIIVFFMPFVIGWIIALIANPLVHFFEAKFKIKRKAGTAFVVVAVIALVVLAIYLIGAKVVQEAVGLIHELPSMWSGIEEDFRIIAKKMDVLYRRFPLDIRNAIATIGENLGTYLGSGVGQAGTPTIEAVGNFAKHVPSAIIGVIMCLLSAYFFVAERDYMAKLVKEHMPVAVTYRWDMMSRSLKRAVGGYFKAQFKIEIWMYLLLVIGFSILNVKYALLIALGVAALDFFPVFGTGTVLIPWAIIKILSADYKMAVGLLIIWCGGQLARQIIQPKIVGDSIGVAPIPTLFLLFIGYQVAGVLGMILAVPIGIIILNMYQEGVFDTTLNSLKILFAGINNFRRLNEEDMAGVRDYKAYEQKKLEEHKSASEQESK